ncbi:MAG TPA: hypothetical protein VF618_19190 [Thermoanaerobaculia bacterium]
MTSRLATPATYVTFFLLAALAPLRALRDYDYYWHLATGHWIHEHRALPRTDPFGAGSDPGPWINGEWLFQFLLYPLHGLGGGVNAMVAARALFIGALFTLLLWWTHRATQSLGVALAVCTLAWFGAVGFFSERPATFATAFVVVALGMVLRTAPPSAARTTDNGQRTTPGPTNRQIILYALLTIVWINFHPSALLAPVIAGLVGWNSRRGIVRAVVSALALLVNPYGIEAILAPQRLVHWVSTGPFVNREWQPSSPAMFPLLYAMIAAGAVLFVWRRGELARALLFLFFSIMAIRYLRNQAVFYVAWPLLVAPLLPRFDSALLRRVLGFASVAFMLTMLLTRDLETGIDEHVLPVHAAAELQRLAPPGNIFAAGHFGGYLIWQFVGERRVVNDGRNELHKTLLTEYARARQDPRVWRGILQKYRITSALDAYQPPINGMAASLVLYPRNEWALVAFDDAGMAFIRRDGRDLRGIEYQVLVPDDPERSYDARAIPELQRVHRLVGGESAIVHRLAQKIR